MNKNNELICFESGFEETVIEIGAVIGESGIGAGRSSGSTMWNASTKLIAWKNLHNNSPIVKEEVRLEWLVDDEGWEETKGQLQSNSIVRLQVRMGERSMMLIGVSEHNYKDIELEFILNEYLEPVYYNDNKLGQFELDKRVKWFEKDILWLDKPCKLNFDWDKDENVMKRSVYTAHNLFDNQVDWNRKIRSYAAEELLELANDWLEDIGDIGISEINKEMFMRKIEIESISVYSNGEFEVFFSDGGMFAGHCIIVDGHIEEGLNSADIAG